MEEKVVTHSNDNDFQKKVEDLLLFRKVVSVREFGDQVAELTLDNGVVLVTEGNEGCGGCGNGWYYLNALNRCDNAITKVECEDDGETYSIFVFAENEKITLVQYDGYDNGYYGTGYTLSVRMPDSMTQ